MRRGILVVAPWLPWPADFGGALRVYHLIRELSRDHDVMLVAPAHADEWQAALRLGDVCDVTVVPASWTLRHPPGPGKRLQQLRSLLDRRSFLEQVAWNAQLQSVIERLFMTRTIDIVQYEFPQMALHQPPRPRPIVIDSMDIQHELLRRVARTNDSMGHKTFNLLEWRKVRRLEEHLWRRATVNVVTSDRDADVVREGAGEPVIVVPNGVDAAAFAPLRESSPRPHHAVFIGAMRHQPNATAARWYVEHVHPRVHAQLPDATVSIVGADPPPSVTALASGTAAVTGYVDDIRPYLAEASVAVVPLLSGGGTRLKILEAWAAGRPLVSTTLGAEGLDARDGENILLADTPEEFAMAVVRVVSDLDLAQALVEEGIRTARELYDWSIVAERLTNAHDLAIARFRSSG